MTVEVDNMEAVALDHPAPEPFELRVADRCDQCGAQAFVIVTHPEAGSLWFCGHHAAEHEIPLFEQGFQISADARETINRKPGGSA